MTDYDEEIEEKEEKNKFTLCRLLGDAATIARYTLLLKAKGAVNGVKDAKEWAEEHGEDVKRGYKIGYDLGNFLSYLKPVVRDIFKGNEPSPREVTEDSPLSVRTAEEYTQRSDSVPEEAQGPISAATWFVGFLPGVASYGVVSFITLLAWPFKTVYNYIAQRREHREILLEEGPLEKAVKEASD